jgi:hypothetical protein
MLSSIAIASSSYPPLPPISSEHVHSSSSSELLTGDTKVVLDFFLSGEIIVQGLTCPLVYALLCASLVNEINVLVKVML